VSTLQIPRREYEGWIEENADQEWRLVCMTKAATTGRFGQLLGRPMDDGPPAPDERLSCALAEGELYSHPHTISCERLNDEEIVWVAGVSLWAGAKLLREWSHPGLWLAQRDALAYIIDLQAVG
jgi:hypothetical protein